MGKEEELQFKSRVEEFMLNTQKETKNSEVENLQKQLKEIKVQFAEFESRMVVSVKSEVRAEVKKEVDKVLPTAVEQGLRDLPFEMVCAYKGTWTASNSIIDYDRITAEFNNSDRPGGGDGRMNIETGVFTTVTSGYYIVTY